MSKKSNTKFLLLGVILIYGAIVVRFFMLRSAGASDIPVTNIVADFTPKSYEVQEDFTIANNHRDPFLGTRPKEAIIKKATTKPQIVENPTAYFPAVLYKGLVSDIDSKKKVISLAVNDKEYIIREGKTVDSVTILSGNAKELKVSYKGVVKTLKISN